MATTPTKNEPKKQKAGKNARAVSEKKEPEKKGWRDVLVWIIPIGIGFILAAIGIVYFLNIRLAIALIVFAIVSFLAFFLFLAEWYVWKNKRIVESLGWFS